MKIRNKKWYLIGSLLVSLGALSGNMMASAHILPTHRSAKMNLADLMHTARIGIVSPMGMEQAPILAQIHVQAQTTIDGFLFYIGTLDGKPVVNVRSGEKEYSAEMATMLMDTHFHIIANFMPGTAGSRNPNVKVGDVVLGAFVVDKSSIHYHNRGFQSPYTGVEMVVNPSSLTANDPVGTMGAVGPTPQDAKSYGGGPSTQTKQYVYYTALSASAALVKVGEKAPVGVTKVSDITGSSNAKGSKPAHVMAGVIGSANQWTEPLTWMEDQNALYQSDAGENEGMAFGFANTQLGVPWLVVRGISDSAWYPQAYDGVLAADRAAQVTAYIIAHMPTASKLASTSTQPILSIDSNATMHGYIVASKAYYGVDGKVTEIVYSNAQGKTVTVKNPSESEYNYPKA